MSLAIIGTFRIFDSVYDINSSYFEDFKKIDKSFFFIVMMEDLKFLARKLLIFQ